MCQTLLLGIRDTIENRDGMVNKTNNLCFHGACIIVKGWRMGRREIDEKPTKKQGNL